MALQKQQIPISFAGGIDTKTDDKQIVATKLLELENGVFTKKGSIHKRHGNDILKTSILGTSSSVASGAGLAAFKDQLVLFDGNKLYDYVESSAAWLQKGNISSVTNTNRSVIRNIYQQTDVDYAYNSGISAYVWKDSSNGCRYSIVDESTGSIIQSNQVLSATGISPRAIGLGRYIFFFYIEGTTLKLKTVQISNPSVISASEDVSTSLHASNKIYDVQLIGSRVYLAYNTNATSIATSYINATKVISNEVFISAQAASNAISITNDQNNNIWISWSNGSAVKYYIWDYSLNSTPVLTTTLIETIANIRNIASISTANNVVTFMYEKVNSNGNYLKKVTANVSGTVGTPAIFNRAVGLASKFFTYAGQYYFTAAFQSNLQSTYFVFSLDGNIVTKMNTNTGGGYTSSSILPTVVSIDDGVFIIPNLRKGVILTEAGTAFTSVGVNSTKIDFNSLNNFITADLGNALHIVGGIMQSYDGNSICETGFNQFPESISAAETSVGTGNIPNGTYQYSVVYAWIDNAGQQHRSAPSIGYQFQVSTGPSNVQLTIPTLRLTNKQNVFIEVYRTEASGTIFYKVSSNTSLTANDPTADTITFTDTISNTAVIAGELLYTVSGELDNIAPPSASAAVNWKNRIVLKSTDEENLLVFSKIRQDGKPVEFSDELIISVDPRGGDITALGAMDDKLIIFKKNSIHIQAGDGPNNLGEQSDFGLPQLVTADAGCVDVNSVVETPLGLMFKSDKGIYLLDRSLSVKYVGAEVEAYNANRITAAKLIPDTNQIRFYTEDSLCLVFDYFYNQWSTFTNHEAMGAAVYQGKACFIKSDGRVFKENNSFADGAQRVKLKLVTAWMNVGELSGFERFYKLILLGTYKTKHSLRVRLGFDFNNSFVEETLIDVAAAISDDFYGDSSPYGDDSVYGGPAPLYRWRVFPKRQKCSAFRISIEDVMTDVFDESFSISNLRLEVGVKQGSQKLESVRSSASS